MQRYLGYTKPNIWSLDKTLSHSINGCNFSGLQMDAVFNGIAEGFQGKVFFDATAYGTPVQATSTASKTYILHTCQQYFQVLTDATGAGATAGIPDAVAGSARGVLRLEVTDAASNGIGFTQADQRWVNPGSDFRFSCAIAALANTEVANTVALGHFGLMGDKGANFLVVDNMQTNLTNAPSTDFVCVEVSANRLRLVSKDSAAATAIITSGWVQFDPSNGVSFMIEGNGNNYVLFVDGREAERLTRSVALVATQVFGRVGHTASYSAATNSAFRIDLDEVVCSVPLYQAN